MRYVYILLAAIVVLSSAQVQAQPESKSGFLPVFGTITKGGKKAKEAKIRVYEGNNLWTEFEANSKGNFESMLELNKYYTFEFISDGAVTKRIAVNTSVENKGLAAIPFKCFVDLVPDEKVEGSDTSTLDFPVAIVRYNAKKRVFEPDLEYFMNMMKEYDKAMAQSEE